ncbi:hypothetical protein JOD57_003219 [Geodermatophilus bullaregiensis]|uniref:hypothetical protein n=1 Tax=Geodermatophilus bullaregiensis TaxID=1564160 RepID=UPI00195BE513|nr:hypothetical protein [Geodermatophilus bullaregiensis]MBM7807382.1 hypothetical protein [Geodermatophilus bullaregiensis]
MRLPEQYGSWRGPTGRRLLLVAAGAVLAAALLALAVAGSGDGGPGVSAAPTTTEATPTPAPTEIVEPTGTVPPPPPTPEPTGPTEAADELPPRLAPVALTEQAGVGNGVTAAVEGIEAIEAGGQGPGQVGGPAVRVTVRITNGTDAPVSLDAVAVDLSHGPGAAPASPLDDPSSAPFTGTAGPGADATGVYVFSVPEGERDALTLAVGYQAGAPYLVFTGSAD